MPLMDAVEHLADLLRNAKIGVAFTGAGISTESGIPDFRSPGGVWSKNTPVMYDDFLRSRSERVRYWKMRREMYPDFLAAKPNDGHRAIARLEQLGKLVAVVTQNIDSLHQRAGSARVVELHGTTRMVACVACGKEWEPQVIIARLDAGEEDPDCNECGSPIKSKTISFGQAMPQREMEDAHQLSTDADVYLAIGSSLVVEPAASLPRLAKSYGATLVILNKTPTPLDPIADLVIREPIGVTMRTVLQRLDPNGTSN
ncbi:MAG: NAD-dependent deacylase [Planctomycetes bacterium]|nr:NAD-dependent deacylase [Planctomycetota bacterium]